MTASLSGRAPAPAGGARLRGGRVVAQVALSVVLLVAAGLFIRSFQRMAEVPLGFASDRVLVVDVNASRAPIDAASRAAFYERLVTAVQAIPGVTHAAASLNTPVNRGATLVGDFDVLGRAPLPPTERRVIVNHVTSNWFAAYGITVRRGRVIAAGDTVTSAPVVVANDAFVRRFLPDRPVALGEVVVEAYPDGPPPVPRTIVGVVNDTVEQSLRYSAYPMLYQPLAQWGLLMPMMPPPTQISLSVRVASGSPTLLARSVATALTGVDRTLAFSFRPLADQVDAARHQERLVAWLSGFFGALALLLAMIGLYGVTAYGVAQRRAEIGIRMALGARRHDVLHLALRQTTLWTISGVAVGLAAAAAVTRYLEAMLFGITPLDPVTFIGAPVLLALVAGLAALIPAKRAATVDPMVVLRCE
jgi:putative ABC transport system permease protein